MEIQKLRMSYHHWDDEYIIQLQVNKIGMYSVVTKNIKNGKKGFCSHIGKDYHISESFNKIKIIGRKDFPDKIHILLKDI
jgi:hypothetical protein